MSPGFWLHHAALAWRQVFDRRLRPLYLSPTQFMLLASAGWLVTTSGGPPTQQEVADHADADRMLASKVLQTLVDRDLMVRSPIRCARPSRTSPPGPGPIPDPYGTRARNGVISTCPQRDSNPCRRLERAVS